jgi:putative endonuclease
MKGSWLYIIQHRDGAGGAFTTSYRLTRLLYAEHHAEILRVIQREKTIKHWRRAWKVRLIQSTNWEWDDLTP